MLTTSIRYPCIHKPNYKTQSYYNASCSLFEPCHRPYAYLTLTTMIVFFFLPTLYLFLHPCKLFHRFNFLKLRIMLLPHEIAKVFHQSFKDGIHEGTRDCRWFAGSYLLIRLFITASLVSFRSTQAIQILACVTGTLLVAIFQPHTHTSFNCMDAMLFAALAVCLLLWPGGHNQHIGQVLIFFVPLLVLLVFVGWKLFRKLAIGGRLKWCYYCCCGQLRDGVLSFRELQRLCHGGNGGASAIEQRPLLVKENSPDVPCTVVDIPK